MLAKTETLEVQLFGCAAIEAAPVVSCCNAGVNVGDGELNAAAVVAGLPLALACDTAAQGRLTLA